MSLSHRLSQVVGFVGVWITKFPFRKPRVLSCGPGGGFLSLPPGYFPN